jgi:hypothetical protein
MKKTSMKKSVKAKKPASRGSGRIQGEGDYEASRRYRKEVETFVKSADIPAAARAAAPKNAREAREMKKAEAIGRSHARRDPKDRMR